MRGRVGCCLSALMWVTLSFVSPRVSAAATQPALPPPSIVATPFQSSAVAIAAQESVHSLIAQASVTMPEGACSLVVQGTPLALATPAANANAAAVGFWLPGPGNGGEILSATASGADGQVAEGAVTLPTVGSTLAQFSVAHASASFTLSESLQYDVPSDAYAGTYTASLVLSLACTPPPVSSAAS